MRLNVKRVMSWCGGLSIAVFAAFSQAPSASAQGFIEVLPEVGTTREVGRTSSTRPEDGEVSWVTIYEERLENPYEGFRAYNIWAEVTPAGGAGTFVNAFENLNISGVHQVRLNFFGNIQSSHYANFWDTQSPELKTLDSYLGFVGANKSNGADPSESIDPSNMNPGGLDPTEIDPDFPLPASVVEMGIGELGIIDRGNPQARTAMGLAIQPNRLHLAHIVLYDGLEPENYATALLTGRLGGEINGNIQQGDTLDIPLNGIELGAPELVIPEPSMSILALMGFVGLCGLRRRVG
jgi:hypothetical protein